MSPSAPNSTLPTKDAIEEARANLTEALTLFFEAAHPSKISGADVCRPWRLMGFEQVRQQGSHLVMQKQAKDTTTTIPVPPA